MQPTWLDNTLVYETPICACCHTVTHEGFYLNDGTFKCDKCLGVLQATLETNVMSEGLSCLEEASHIALVKEQEIANAEGDEQLFYAIEWQLANEIPLAK